MLKNFLSRRQAPAETDEAVRESVTDAGYYEEVSLRYATLQFVIIILMTVFLAVSLLSDSAMLSGQSLSFFIKDMSASVLVEERSAKDTLVYTADDDNRYALFRDGLAVLGGEKLTVFTATGRETLSEYFSYAFPALSSSGHYLIAYDLGGTEYRVYNSFTCVERGKTAQGIRAVTAANNGSYAIVTSDAEYASLVTLFDDRHRPIAYYRLKQYTACADLNEDGSMIALGSFSSENGRMTTHLMLSEPGQDRALAEWTVSDAYPVDIQLNDQGLVLLSTAFVAWFDLSGRELARQACAASDVSSAILNDRGCVLLCRADAHRTDTRVLAFDNRGRMVYNIVSKGIVTDAALFGDTLGILGKETLTVYTGGAQTPSSEIELVGNYEALLCCAEDELVLCGEARATIVYH
jgi:hypothetical protein